MRQNQVLLVADADFVRTRSAASSATSSICADRGVARHAAERLQRHRDDRIARAACADARCCAPSARTPRSRRFGCSYATSDTGERLESRRREIGADARHFRRRQIRCALLARCAAIPLRPGGDIRARAKRRDENLDARLVDDCRGGHSDCRRAGTLRDRTSRSSPRHELADQRRDHAACAPAAADIARRSRRVAGARAVMCRPISCTRIGGAVVLGAGHRDLELARQEREFRMERRPLPDDLAPGARIFDFVRGRAGEMIGGDVADAIAARSGSRASRRRRARPGSSGTSFSLIQLNWRFCRVVKWP